MSRPNYDDIHYYDCANKPDGNYVHPPTAPFITCHSGRAVDMACLDCGLRDNPYQCAGSEYLFYDPKHDWCEWLREVACIHTPGCYG